MNEKNELQKKIRCNICNKQYASQSSLCNHNKKFHNLNNNPNNLNNNLNNNPNNLNNNPNDTPNKKYNCNICNKEFKYFQNRWRHVKICKMKDNKINETSLIEENKMLKEELTEIKKLLLQHTKIHPKILQRINKNLLNCNNTTNNTTNNTINNNNINITYVKFGNEHLSQLLSKKEMQKIISKVRLSLEESIKMVHFNNERPEYKNIMITNMRDDLAYIFNGSKFEAVSKEKVLKELLNDHLSNIESYIEESNIEDNFKNRHLFKFIREINGQAKNDDIKDYKIYKLNKIKQLVYNNTDQKILKQINSIDLNEKIIGDINSESSDNN